MQRFFRVTAVAAGVASVALIAHAQSANVESTRVLRSPRGETVTLIQLKPVADGNAIIQVTGTKSPFDGLALPYKRSSNGNSDYYTTQWRGRSFSFVQVHHGGRERWELYLPGDVRTAHPVSGDEAASKAANAAAILAQHEKQKADGTLARFSNFSRKDEQAEQDKSLADAVAEADKVCGSKLRATIAWASVSDEVMKTYSVSSFCSTPVNVLAELCKKTPAAAGMLRDKVKELSCSWGGPHKLTLTGSKLEAAVDPEKSNHDDFATKALEALEVAPALAKTAGDAAPWGDGRTLGQRITLAQAGVCTDGKGHYVMHMPSGGSSPLLYYGDGKRMTRVPIVDLLGGMTFFDPRFVNPTANPNFRGADIRVHSSVIVDAGKGTCAVHCGPSHTDLKVMTGAEATSLLTAASFAPIPNLHVPHALARDERGNYYYVDKGSTQATATSFRLFVGPKGNMKLQKMTNVVSDSQGEIFSTKTGDLRFIVGPGGTQSTWVKGAARTSLLAVPVADNLHMIWTELGVYAGEKRQNPCDDL
ncbi:MAG TPA: hypothetical protein PKI03_28500 [Pseudomonadota bacterium]|nr:hypothetical protein [Pseudomonadota bacterium]